MPPQTPYNGGGSDVVNCWPPAFSMNNDDQHSQVEQQPFKRARNSEERQSNPMPYPPMNYRVQQPSAPVNKGASNIFYKTRLCVNFKSGMCRNGENCNYAHGIEDIRHPPPNWQELVSVRDEDRPLSGNWDDDQKIIHRMKLCKKFYNGEECPYGDRCNFLHEDPSKFRDDSGRFRENTAISIGTTGAPVAHGSGSNPPEENRLVNTGMDASRGNVKPVYWKTKLCNKWETTGKCPFGEKCHFAHGLTGSQCLCLVVIMLVIDRENDRALLSRQFRFVPRMWSCLAGFIEPGESLEEAVRRETWEETGIEVGEVVYHSSQPWPVGPSSMPCQLMVGFFAYAKSLEINVDKEELEDAQWHSREDVKRALTFAEYKKAQRTAATRVEQMCKGVEKEQSLSADFNVESGELASMFIPGPFAIAHHLISSWAYQDATDGAAALKQSGGSTSNL
ncbi:hypothetical protein C1H46_017243 [Malus baccata]|uniref:NAD(+) diphosphatase n=1 Tax=Malus baccata TaxID=106549 RepID=A0A540MEK1_MALBA|nr:hypothetical protein C1H46_017243 [Malus baccata]